MSDPLILSKSHLAVREEGILATCDTQTTAGLRSDHMGKG